MKGLTTRMRRRHDAESFVYFVRAGTAGPIKIGISNQPARRISRAQGYHYEELITMAVVTGSWHDEIGVHEKFSHLRIRGEWFRSEPELIEFIDKAKTLSSLESLIPAPRHLPRKIQPARSVAVTVEGIQKILNATIGRRDKAIIRLLYDLALLTREIVDLNMEDIDLKNRTILVRGWGQIEKTLLSIPAPTAAAIDAWITERGWHDGPLFVGLDKRSKSRGVEMRLAANSISIMVAKISSSVGEKTSPHGIRKTAICHAMTVTNGNLDAVIKFSRHGRTASGRFSIPASFLPTHNKIELADKATK